MFVGIDFGTTNSAVGVVHENGEASIIRHADTARPGNGPETRGSDTLRSMVAFERRRRGEAGSPPPLIGHDAVAAYLRGDEECRLLQSFKSYLTSRLFNSATIFNTAYSLEHLIALVVGRLRHGVEADARREVRRVVAGRPVRFVAEDGTPADDYAEARLRQAFAQAGIDEVVFEYEPIAAAYYYERGLDHDETVLVADFGGGTSDFCLVRLGPGRARLARPEDAILATGGLGLAGDTFDRRIIERGIAEYFGKNTTYTSNGKDLPVPDWIYGRFARWHHIGFLGTSSTLRMLEEIRAQASHPHRIDNLLTLIDYNLGYHLYRAVEAVKIGLSCAEETTFVFDQDGIHIRRPITRSDFESWIAPELAEIETCVETLLADAGIAASQVDRVFMTGGTSLTPAVRAIFARHFGENRLNRGGEFVSVASGLAYRAREIFAGR